MTTYFDLKDDAVMPEELEKEIDEAAKRPVVYDDDSPKLTEKMEKAFIEARKKKPYQGKQVTVYLSNDSIERATRIFGENYTQGLEKLLDKAIHDCAV